MFLSCLGTQLSIDHPFPMAKINTLLIRKQFMNVTVAAYMKVNNSAWVNVCNVCIEVRVMCVCVAAQCVQNVRVQFFGPRIRLTPQKKLNAESRSE